MTGVSIKSKGPEGVRVEENVAAEVKGFGRFPSGRNIGAMELVTTPDGNASGTGQVTFTSQEGDSTVWKFYVLGKIEEGKIKGVIIIQMMTTSQRRSWMNGLIAIDEAISDRKTMEYSETGYEWK